MNRSILKRWVFVWVLLGVSLLLRADAPDESENLRAIARELDYLRSLVDSSATISFEHEQRLRFDYDYVIDALDYLKGSVVTHVQLRQRQSTEQWDLNQRSKLPTRTPITVVAESMTREASGTTEQERLADIAREIALVREVVERASLQANEQHSRVSFDYGYMLAVMAYLDYAVRAHLSLQNAVPRTQWDHNRRTRLSSDSKVVLE